MKLKPTLKYAEEPDVNELVIVKKINDWLVESRAEPVPKMLFGEFWLEGELAVLAADSGAGKSLLAVQIAESIASGRNPDAVTLRHGDAGISGHPLPASRPHRVVRTGAAKDDGEAAKGTLS